MLTMTPEQYEAHQRRVKGARTVLAFPEEVKAGRQKKVKPVSAKRPIVTLEGKLDKQLRLIGIALERQYRWYPGRRYRADFAHPPTRLIVELDGEAHRIKNRFHDDIRKSQDAILIGWRLLRISTGQVRDGTAVEIIRRAIDSVNSPPF